MKKIGIYLTSKPNNGGVYQYWLAIIKAMSSFKHDEYEIVIISPYLEWSDKANQFNIKYLHYNDKFSPFLSKVDFALTKILPSCMIKRISSIWLKEVRKIKKEKFDLIISQDPYGLVYRLGVPYMTPVHDLMHRYETSFPEVRSHYKEREKLYQYIAKSASSILVDSIIGKKQVYESYSNYSKDLKDKISVLPYVPPDYIYQYKDTLYETELPFEKYIFYPAQFWKHKNHFKLIDAIAQLKKQDVIINAIFVGAEQNNETSLNEKIKNEGLDSHIKILGYVSDEKLVCLYKHARALVMPTYFGPTNIPQLEAFELECPVATSKIYGIPNQVGDAALLFDPNSVEEIAQSIERLWSDDNLCNKLIANGKKKANEWNPDRFNEKLQSIIDDYFEERK